MRKIEVSLTDNNHVSIGRRYADGGKTAWFLTPEEAHKLHDDLGELLRGE